MPGRFVFPGGRVDAPDARMPAAAPLDATTERRLMQHVRRPTRARARALVLTAIRETFEETGILLGRKNATGHPLFPCRPDRHCRRTCRCLRS
jgi:8-oxo-dGTP pyrophosphatase MutT (NUDIX family)